MKFINETTDVPMEPLIEKRYDKNDRKLSIEKFRRYIRSRRPISKAYNGPFKFINDAIVDNAKQIVANDSSISLDVAIQFSYCNIMEHYIVELWNKTKQVYELNNTFANDLFHTEVDLIPYEIFALPYSTFCIDYNFTTHGMRCEGLIVDVLVNGRFVVVTTIAIFNGGDMRGLFTNEYDFREGLMCKVNEEDGTRKKDTIPAPAVDDIWNIVCQFCMFLSQSKPDDVVKAKPSKGHGKKKQKVKDVSKWEVGFRYGETIKNMVKPKMESTTTQSTDKTHASPKPHVRKAHWQHYHTGKGRTEIVLKWKAPSLINAETSDDLPVVAHK